MDLESLKNYVKNEIPLEHWLGFVNDEEIQDKINDARKKLGKKSLKFTSNFNPPTYNDIVVYMSEYKAKNNLIFDEKKMAAKFYDRQLQIGWQVKVGQQLYPMKDWKAAVRTHLRFEFDYGNIKRKE